MTDFNKLNNVDLEDIFLGVQDSQWTEVYNKSADGVVYGAIPEISASHLPVNATRAISITPEVLGAFISLKRNVASVIDELYEEDLDYFADRLVAAHDLNEEEFEELGEES